MTELVELYLLTLLREHPFLRWKIYNSDSFATSPKTVVFLQSEVESFQTVIMLAMMIGAVNFEKEFASMKATLERLS